MQFLKDGNVFCFGVPSSITHYLQDCMLENSFTKCEIHDMYICVRGAHVKTLVGRDHIGTEILMSVLQPMRKLDYWKMSESMNFVVLCVLQELSWQANP